MTALVSLRLNFGACRKIVTDFRRNPASAALSGAYFVLLPALSLIWVNLGGLAFMLPRQLTQRRCGGKSVDATAKRSGRTKPMRAHERR
jgi:hypothetical protein